VTSTLLFARRVIIQWVTFDMIEAELYRRGVDLSNGRFSRVRVPSQAPAPTLCSTASARGDHCRRGVGGGLDKRAASRIDQ
jgi:hypothetical protein